MSPRPIIKEKKPTEGVQHLHLVRDRNGVLAVVKYSTFPLHFTASLLLNLRHAFQSQIAVPRLSCPIYKGKHKTLCPPNPSHFPASPPERWRLHLYARTRVRVGLSTRRYGVFLLSSRRSFVLRRLLSRIRRAKPPRIW